MTFVLKDLKIQVELQLVLLTTSIKDLKVFLLNSIRGIGLDSVIEGINGNNLKLPLMANSNKTKYIFEYNKL